MTYETGKQAIDFLLEKSLDRKNLEPIYKFIREKRENEAQLSQADPLV